MANLSSKVRCPPFLRKLPLQVLLQKYPDRICVSAYHSTTKLMVTIKKKIKRVPYSRIVLRQNMFEEQKEKEGKRGKNEDKKEIEKQRITCASHDKIEIEDRELLTKSTIDIERGPSEKDCSNSGNVELRLLEINENITSKNQNRSEETPHNLLKKVKLDFEIPRIEYVIQLMSVTNLKFNKFINPVIDSAPKINSKESENKILDLDSRSNIK